MTYLLDTSTWLWLVESPQNLSPKAAAIISKFEDAPFALSAISIWEVAKKVSIGKLKLSMPLREWVAQAIRGPFIQVIPVSLEIALEANQLPPTFHTDPADQMIVATARILDLRLITRDRLILDYSHVKTVW